METKNKADFCISKVYNATSKSWLKFMGDDSLKVQTTNIQELYNYFLQYGSEQVLVIDFRSKATFQKSHVVDSVNIPYDEFKVSELITFDEKKFIERYCDTKTNTAKFKLRKRWFILLICFEHHIPEVFNYAKFDLDDTSFITEDHLSYRNAIMFKKFLVAEKHRDSFLCKTSMRRISKEYPFLCKYENLAPSKLKEVSDFASEIFENCLYLGSKDTAKNERILQSLGITHIFNVSHDVENYFENDSHISVQYEKINIKDEENEPIHIFFKQAYDFIDSALFINSDLPNYEKSQEMSFADQKEEIEKVVHNSHRWDFDTQILRLKLNNKDTEYWNSDEDKQVGMFCDINIFEMHKAQPRHKLLIHCAMGMSRSATITAMFIMRKFSLPYKLALNLLSNRRKKIDINTGFSTQLSLFEQNDFKFPTENLDKEGESTEAEDDLLN